MTGHSALVLVTLKLIRLPARTDLLLYSPQKGQSSKLNLDYIIIIIIIIIYLLNKHE